jgi:PAS domain S-box-containing protein
MIFNILIANDEKSNLKEFLQVSVKEVNIITPSDSLELLNESIYQNINLVILNIQKDDYQSFEVAKFIKSIAPRETLPILFLSDNLTSIDFINYGFKFDEIDYLSKPIDECMLINKIKNYKEIYRYKNLSLSSELRAESFNDINILSNILDESIEEIIVLDAFSGSIVYANNRASANLGYSKSTLLRMNITDIEINIPNHSIWLKHVKALKVNKKAMLRGIHKRVDSSTYIADIVSSIITVGDKDYIIIFVKDVTKEIQRNKEYELLNNDMKNFYHLFDVGNIVVFKWKNDPSWSVEYVSKNVYDVLGYSKYELENSIVEYKEIVFKTDLERVVEEVESSVSNEVDNFTHKEYRLKRRDGKVLWVNDTTHIIRDKKGKVTHFLGYITDITKQHTTTEELLDVSSRFRLALEGTKDGLWDWDMSTNRVFFSKKWKEMLGYQEEELANRLETWTSRIHPDDVDMVFDAINAHFAKDVEYYETEYKIKCKDGSYKWILDRGKALFDENDKAYRMIGFHTDMTEKKSLENKLRELNKKSIEYNRQLQKAQEVAHLGYWNYRQEGATLYWSDEVYNIFGIEDKSVELSLDYFYSFLLDSDTDRGKREFLESVRDKSPYKIVHKIATPKGEIKYIKGESEHKYDDSGHFVESIGTVLDITELKDTELKLEELNQNLKEEVQSKVSELREKEQMLIQQSKMAAMGEMIGSIAHQWRQPLNALSILKDTVVDDYYENALSDDIMDRFEERANNLISYMSKTIDDFRNFFIPSKSKIKFNLIEEINSIQDIVLAQLKSNAIALNITHKDSTIEIISYPNEFKQVILNIINNSKDAIVKLSKKGKIDIDISQDSRHIYIYITDNGGGIDDDIIDKVFEPYFTTKFQAQGTGLGLYMAKTIIENSMDGVLSVENIEDGAKFIIKLDRDL